VGVLQERDNRLAEAVRTFESARRLDPQSAAIEKALVPLYLALERVDDGLASCRRALELNPQDYETSYLFAKQLLKLDRRKEAITELKRTVRCKGLEARPDLLAQAWFDLGILHEQESDWPGAEKALGEVVKILDKPGPLLELGGVTREEINGQAAETWERLGQAALKAGNPARAVAAFHQAQKKDPIRGPRLALNLARVYEGQGKHGPALDQLTRYLATQPQGTEGYELKITLQRRLGRAADIVPDLELASGRDPHNHALKLLLAREQRKAGLPGPAERTYKDLLSRTATPEVYRGLFELYKDKGRKGGELVLDLLDSAIARGTGQEKKPGSAAEAASARAMLVVLREDADLVRLVLPAAQSRLKAGRKMAFTTRALLATVAARTNQLGLAEALYRSCLDQPGGPAESEAEVYAGLLRVLTFAHKHEAIVALCKQGLTKAHATNRLVFHPYLARAHVALGNKKEALEAADVAIKEATEGQLLRMKLLRVEALSELGEHARAVKEGEALLRAYNQGEDLREVRVRLSSVHLAAGQPDRSEEQLQLVLKADPSDALVNNNLGYQWADRNKNLPEAEKLIRKALELDRRQRTSGTSISAAADQDNPAYIDSLGWVLFRRGKLTEAARELERASALPGGDDDPVVWDHLGDVYVRLKERAKALAAYRKALALYEAGARRKSDGRHGEIQTKVRTLGP
jgi:tetratricopeptide (TPR) repeat protein